MKSNNNPNQVPDPAAFLYVSFSYLLNSIINREDIEEAKKILGENWNPMEDQVNSLDGTGVPQVQMASTSMAWIAVATAQYFTSAQTPLMIQTNSHVASAQTPSSTQNSC